MKDQSLILQLVSESQPVQHISKVFNLEQYGCKVVRCTSLAGARVHLQNASQFDPSLVIALLDLGHVENCTFASALRATNAAIGIVALVDDSMDIHVIQQLQSGADVYCPKDASPELLAAIVFRLLWRLGAAPQLRHGRDPEYSTGWRLADNDWALCTPNGQRIALTTGERAFLSTLLYAPQQRASHQDLIQAVNVSYDMASPRTRQNRLGVMVSRMRRKFVQAGAPLPLKSVHNWGYMFSGTAHNEKIQAVAVEEPVDYMPL